MIGWDDIYKVLAAMFPLYTALILGYGSVKWWHMFNSDQCDAINRLNCYFIMPLFTFDFTTRVNPYKMHYRFLAADAISKAIILLAILLWANFTSKGNYPWSITCFSLSSLNNALVVGVPLMAAMYGPFGENLVIQSSIMQFMLWIMIVLFMFELQHAKKSLDAAVPSLESATNCERTNVVDTSKRNSLFTLAKIVGLKLAKNPNAYACGLGLVWALMSNRWNLEMPSLMQGSVQIMSRAGAGIAMFCMGLFMAMQDKMIDCKTKLVVLGMVLRFMVAPATVAIGSFIVGLRGDVLHVAIIQAALPQAIGSFVLAKEYGLHANLLSTAVIFGTLISIPVLIAYYVVLNFLL
ncbi:auxin efflux carrier component 5-like [Bidens hawaiensis]|uniref:auxin efflux carrier component 5-like n=1 Tax=Bidens hawaiensis TaxID=980011 RepID=UPI0040497A63